MAEKIVPAGHERCNTAGLPVLGSTNTVPSVDIEVLALHCHFKPCYHIGFQ